MKQKGNAVGWSWTFIRKGKERKTNSVVSWLSWCLHLIQTKKWQLKAAGANGQEYHWSVCIKENWTCSICGKRSLPFSFLLLYFAKQHCVATKSKVLKRKPAYNNDNLHYLELLKFKFSWLDFKRALNSNSLEEQKWNSLNAGQTSEGMMNIFWGLTCTQWTLHATVANTHWNF